MSTTPNKFARKPAATTERPASAADLLQPTGKAETARLSIDVTPELHRQLKVRAAMDGVTVSKLIRKAVLDLLATPAAGE